MSGDCVRLCVVEMSSTRHAIIVTRLLQILFCCSVERLSFGVALQLTHRRKWIVFNIVSINHPPFWLSIPFWYLINRSKISSTQIRRIPSLLCIFSAQPNPKVSNQIVQELRPDAAVLLMVLSAMFRYQNYLGYIVSFVTFFICFQPFTASVT